MDPIWSEWSIQTGLSSGEGLIHAVRDSGRKSGEHPPDDGVLDQRLLVIEPEFASPLRMIARDGNTLSPVVRQAWDGGKLQVMTKQSPETATNAHISIIGHVTRDELRRELTRTDAGSGFGNRFLWVCVRRSKLLPDGGLLPEVDFESIKGKLDCSVNFVRELGDHEFKRDHDAKTLWHSIYEANLGRRPGRGWPPDPCARLQPHSGRHADLSRRAGWDELVFAVLQSENWSLLHSYLAGLFHELGEDARRI